MTKLLNIQVPGDAGFPRDFIVEKAALHPDFPGVQNLPAANDYFDFWLVRANYHGASTFTVGKGHKDAPGQYVVWYPNGKMWSGYGKTISQAIQGACESAWKYL